MNVAITIISCTMLFGFSESKKKEIPKKLPEKIPENVLKLEMDQWSLPNAKFCKSMIQSSMPGGILTPWWYDYCDRLWEKNIEKENRLTGKYHIPAYQKVMRNLHMYKQYLKTKVERDQLEQLKLLQKFAR